MTGSYRHACVPLLLAAGLALNGCTGAVIGAGAVGGVAIAQERSVGKAIDDTWISTQVQAELLNTSETLFTNVGVDVIEGRVLLTGNVKTPEDRLKATQVAWKVDGVAEVLNEIAVTDRSGVVNYAKDTWITTQLRTRILTDTEISDINYSLETVNGVVYLFGIANDEKELERVTNHARNIKGVEKVVSHVLLKSDPRRRS